MTEREEVSSGATEGPEIFTVKEAAVFLKLGRTQLYDAIARGEIPHRKIGRSIRLSRAALVAWLNSPCNTPWKGY